MPTRHRELALPLRSRVEAEVDPSMIAKNPAAVCALAHVWRSYRCQYLHEDCIIVLDPRSSLCSGSNEVRDKHYAARRRHGLCNGVEPDRLRTLSGVPTRAALSVEDRDHRLRHRDTPVRATPYICHTAMNMAAIAGPSTKPLMPKTARPPKVVIRTT